MPNFILRRELAIHTRASSDWMAIVIFFLLIVSLVPIAFGPLPADTLWVAPIMIWIAALLATILAQESLWRDDYNLGTLEQLILSPISPTWLYLNKIFAHWLIFALPLIILSPLVALSFALPLSSIQALTLSLLLGTPTLTLLGALAGTLTITLTRGGVMLSLLLLPLYVPVLILGSTMPILSLQDLPYQGHIALLFALNIITILLAPKAITAVLKESVT